MTLYFASHGVHNTGAFIPLREPYITMFTHPTYCEKPFTALCFICGHIECVIMISWIFILNSDTTFTKTVNIFI